MVTERAMKGELTVTCFDCKYRRSIWSSTQGPTAWCSLKACAMAAEVGCQYFERKEARK